MPQSRVLKGADVRIYISGKDYNEAQSISWNIDYGEQPIYGIDSAFPQEIALTKMAVNGTISGIRIKLSGGLQGADIRTKINQILHHPYISLLVKDRHSDMELLWIPHMKVTNESMQITSKSVAQLTFNFTGILPYNSLDLYSS